MTSTIHTSQSDLLWMQLAYLIQIPAVVDRYENDKRRQQQHIREQWKSLAQTRSLKKAGTK